MIVLSSLSMSVIGVNLGRCIRHTAISRHFKNAQYFGFTGTPRFEENKSQEVGLRLIYLRVGVGKLVIISDDFCTSQDFQSLVGIKDDPYFFIYILYKNILKLTSISQGTSIKGFTKSEPINLDINLPTLKEQENIGTFLGRLDRNILLQKKKVELLKQQKKGLMQKIFSKELRFKDESGQEYPEWTIKELGDVLKIRHGKDQKQIETKEGQYPILATGGVIGRTNAAIYNKPSVLIGRKGTINKPQYMNTSFWTVDTLFYSEILELNSPKFIYFIFQNIEWYRYNESTGVPSLSASTIHKIKVEIPNFKEQKRIEELLSTLDNKIVLEQEKSKLLQIQKQAFMQQMFI